MKLDKLKNLGPAATIILSSAGITTVQQLKTIGSVEAYKRVKETGFRVEIDLLYALEGALRNTHCKYLPHHLKRALRIAVETKSKINIRANAG